MLHAAKYDNENPGRNEFRPYNVYQFYGRGLIYQARNDFTG